MVHLDPTVPLGCTVPVHLAQPLHKILSICYGDRELDDFLEAGDAKVEESIHWEGCRVRLVVGVRG